LKGVGQGDELGLEVSKETAEKARQVRMTVTVFSYAGWEGTPIIDSTPPTPKKSNLWAVAEGQVLCRRIKRKVMRINAPAGKYRRNQILKVYNGKPQVQA
jgi:hypothetical protein